MLHLQHDRAGLPFEPARFVQHRQLARIADEDDRAALDLDQPRVARPLLGADGQGVDQHAVAAGLFGRLAGVLAGVRLTVAHQQHAGQRLTTMGGQRRAQRIANGRRRAGRLQRIELVGRQRFQSAGKAIEHHLPLVGQRPEQPADGPPGKLRPGFRRAARSA